MNGKLSMLKWFGGKYFLLDKLLPFPYHKVYADVFGGGASVLLNKIKSKVEIFNDVNDSLVLFWKTFREYYYLFKLAGFAMYNSQSIFNYLRGEGEPEYLPEVLKLLYDGMVHRGLIDEKDVENVAKSLKFYFLNRFSFSGTNTDFHGTPVISEGMYGNASSFFEDVTLGKILEAIDNQVSAGDLKEAGRIVDAVHERIKDVNFMCRDYRTLLPVLDKPRVLVYLDPPYVNAERKYVKMSNNNMMSKNNELWTEDHFHELNTELKKMEHAMWILSIDDASYFDSGNLHVEKIESVSYTSKKIKKKKKTEYIIRNFDKDRVKTMSINDSLSRFLEG